MSSPPVGANGLKQVPVGDDALLLAAGGVGQSRPVTPGHASLYAQIQAAQQSEGGNSAAAAILLARSQELLGMSQQTNPDGSASPNAILDDATRARLWKEGEELKGFANLLLATPEAESVTSMWSTLQSKYNDEGSGLQNEALNLFTQLNSSTEAKELTDTSSDIMRQWREYAATPEGAKVLASSTEMLKSQSSVLAGLLQNLTTSFAGASPAASTNPDGSPVSSVSSSGEPPLLISTLDPNVALVQKETLMKTTGKVQKALADDEDVKLLLAKSGHLLKSYSKEPLKSPDGTILPATNDPANDDLSDPNATVGDAAGVAMKTGESYLKSIRESETGSKMLAKASVLLQQNKNLLRPENLTSLGTTLTNDTDARQQFITKTKDLALEFLLSYLPTVVVPPIVGEKDKVAYEVSNIDLGGFKVDSNHVIVTIDDSNSIQVKATNISCVMKNLIWKYKKLTFPKLSGHGTADANASNVEFILKLKLAYPKPKKPGAQSPTPTNTASTPSSSLTTPPRAATTNPSASPDIVPPTSASAPPEQRQHSLNARSASFAEMKTKVIEAATPKALQRQSLSATNPPTLPSTEAGASSTTTIITPTPSTLAAPIATPAPTPSPSSLGASLLSTVSTDLGQPKLVMDSCFVTLKAFDLQIHTGFLKSIYNFLLGLFKDSVKQYLQNTLNNELVLKSVYLLDTLNVLALDYLPVLQRIMIKAVTAGMAEDDAVTESTTSKDATTTSAATKSITPAPTPTPPTTTTSTTASTPTLQPSLASFYDINSYKVSELNSYYQRIGLPRAIAKR